ncbi:MAG: hypothetical protein V4700_04215 [Pseudomonadota bacterium]
MKNTTPYLEDSSSADEIAETLFSTTDTAVNTALGNSTTVAKHILKSFFSPIIVLFDIVSTLITLIQFLKSDNINLGNIATLAISVITTTLSVIALVCFFASVAPVIVGGLLAVSVAVGFFRDAGLLLYNVYQWRNTSWDTKNAYLKTTYQANTTKYGIAAAVGFTLLLGAVLSLIFFSITAISIISGVLGAIAVVGFLGYHVYKNIKTSSTPNAIIARDSSAESKEDETESATLSDNLIVRPDLQKEKESAWVSKYHVQKHRDNQLTENLDNNRKFLLKEIVEKINSLENEIEKDKGKFFEDILQQEEKRLQKIEFLMESTIFMLPLDNREAENTLCAAMDKIPIPAPRQQKLLTQYLLLNKKITIKNPTLVWRTHKDFSIFEKLLEKNPNSRFQSARKETGDVKDIYEAIKHHFTIEEFIQLKNDREKIQAEKEKSLSEYSESMDKLENKLKTYNKDRKLSNSFKHYNYSEKFREEPLNGRHE